MKITVNMLTPLLTDGIRHFRNQMWTLNYHCLTHKEGRSKQHILILDKCMSGTTVLYRTVPYCSAHSFPVFTGNLSSKDGTPQDMKIIRFSEVGVRTNLVNTCIVSCTVRNLSQSSCLHLNMVGLKDLDDWEPTKTGGLLKQQQWRALF